MPDGTVLNAAEPPLGDTLHTIEKTSYGAALAGGGSQKGGVILIDIGGPNLADPRVIVDASNPIPTTSAQSGNWSIDAVGTVSAVTSITTPVTVINAGTFAVQVDAVPAPLNVVGAGPQAAAQRVTLSDSTTTAVTAANDGSLTSRVGDGTNVATIRNLSNANGMNVAIVDANGDQITSFGGAGGTSAQDTTPFTAGTDLGTPMMGYVGTDNVPAGQQGVVGMEPNRRIHVSIEGVNSTDPLPVSQNGVWNVNQIQTIVDPVQTKATVQTSGGATPGKLISAAGTNATNVKASAGTVYWMFCSNENTARRYAKVYNKATAPIVGTDIPVQTYIVPGRDEGAGFAFPLPSQGMNLDLGFGLAITTGNDDNDTGAVGANEVVINYGFA